MIHWPDPTLPPINLWNAPRQGRNDMSDNFYRAVSEERYLKQTGEADRRRREDEEDRRRADRRQRDAMGEDHPKPFSGD